MRYRVTAELAGKQFETFTLDIGIGDSIPTSPDTLRGPDYFSFAGIDPIEVPALPLEHHVAEKIHAYTRLYGVDRASSRVKDLVDLVLIQMTAVFDADRLREAIDQVFQVRNTHQCPTELPPPPTDWQVRYRTQANDLNLDPEIGIGFRLASDFINPILEHTISGPMRWDPVQGTWLSPEIS